MLDLALTLVSGMRAGKLEADKNFCERISIVKGSEHSATPDHLKLARALADSTSWQLVAAMEAESMCCHPMLRQAGSLSNNALAPFNNSAG